jgi:hypothetical protein
LSAQYNKTFIGLATGFTTFGSIGAARLRRGGKSLSLEEEPSTETCSKLKDVHSIPKTPDV